MRINEAPRPYVYLPFFQAYQPRMVLHTRGAGSVDVLVNEARADVVTLDADLPILFARSLAEGRLGALLLKQSTHEIGIRMALGSSGRRILGAFVARGLRLGAWGAAVGVVVAAATGRFLGGALFGVSATDGVSFARALAIVFGVVLVATLVPSWRAARTNLVAALRHR